MSSGEFGGVEMNRFLAALAHINPMNCGLALGMHCVFHWQCCTLYAGGGQDLALSEWVIQMNSQK